MSALLKKLIRDIWERKLRSGLTILGIAIGIMSLVAINLAAQQLQASLAYSIDLSTQPDIQFSTSPASLSLVNELSRQPNVSIVQPERSVSTRWNIASGHFPLTITGLEDLQHVQINSFELVTGKLPAPGQILLESSDRGIASMQVGGQIEITVRGVSQKLTISGFVRTRGQLAATIQQRGFAYMRESDLEALFHTSGVNTFLFRLHNYNLRNTTARQLAKVFEEQHVLVLGTQIGRSTAISTTADGIFSLLRLFSVVAILLSVFLLLGTVMALLAEQGRVIGMLKALGAVRWRILLHYLLLVAIYGMLGTLIGIGLGLVGGYILVNYLAGLVNLDIGPLNIPSLLLGESLLVGIGAPCLAALLPLMIGTRITVHQALSGYGLSLQGRRHVRGPGRFAGIAGLLPQTLLLGMRNLFRKRARAILTLVTLTVAGVAFLAVQTTSYSFDSFLGQIFATYHFDVIASVPEAQPYNQIQQALITVPGIEKIERLNWHQVQTQWGNGLLTGVQVNTQLYQKQMISGRWFTPDDSNVVIISEDAASKSGLTVGDHVSFHDALHSANWLIIGIARDYNDSGDANFGVLLAPIDQTNAFEHLPAGSTSIVMFQATDRSAAGVNDLAGRIDARLSSLGLVPSVSTARQQIQSNEDRYQVLYLLLYTVVIIVALVGAISLFNTLAMNILERRREIGILRSMGATSRKVVQVFWSEGMATGLLAWVFALCLGIPVAYGFIWLIGQWLVIVPFAFDPLSLLWMLIFLVIVAALASILPVWGVARVRIASTLRYE